MPERRRPTITSLVRGRRSAGRPREHPPDGLTDEVQEGTGRSRLVDSAIYVDGERVASPTSLADTFTALREQPDGMAWIGLYRPEEHEVASLADGVPAARARRRGRDRRASASEARAVRRHAVRRPAPGPVPRRRRRRSSSERCTSSSAPTSCSRSGTAKRPTSARCAAGWRATRSCCARGPEAVLYAIARPGRRRVLPGRRGSRERHRRDRDRGVQRRPAGLPPHLRAVTRGHRVPTGDASPDDDARRR